MKRPRSTDTFDRDAPAGPPQPAAVKARAQLNTVGTATSEAEARDFLAALGLSTTVGTRLVGFGQDHSHIRLFIDPAGELCCQWCRLSAPDFITKNAAEAVAHVWAHRRAGHVVPQWVDEAVQQRL